MDTPRRGSKRESAPGSGGGSVTFSGGYILKYGSGTTQGSWGFRKPTAMKNGWSRFAARSCAVCRAARPSGSSSSFRGEGPHTAPVSSSGTAS